ncbi:MAG: AAA family ATPase [Tannerella sp.]|jgi:hypothetical protein|nr:AAA family ATPase [Tannerella sp.]
MQELKTAIKPKTLHKILKFMFQNRENVLIKGKPGSGKTSVVKQVAEELGMDIVISHPVVSDPTDYKGLPFASPDDREAHFLPFGELNRLIKADKPLLYFMDDIGQSSESVQKSLMCLLLERKINGFNVSDHVIFCAATNRRNDLAGVQGILEPVKSRFATILELETDTDDWIEWAINNNMPVPLISFIRFRPNLLDDFKPTRDIINSPSPRTIAAVGRMQNQGLSEDIMLDVFAGAAGQGFAIEYMSFLKVWTKLPSIDRIIMNPEETPVPTDPATLYALTGMLASNCRDVTCDAIMKYVQRMPTEFATVMVKETQLRWDEFVNTLAYINWACKYLNSI